MNSILISKKLRRSRLVPVLTARGKDGVCSRLDGSMGQERERYLSGLEGPCLFWPGKKRFLFVKSQILSCFLTQNQTISDGLLATNHCRIPPLSGAARRQPTIDRGCREIRGSLDNPVLYGRHWIRYIGETRVRVKGIRD